MINYLLEAIGSFFFFGTILLYASKPNVGPFVIGLALATSLFLTSGHLNPAVTLMFFLKDGSSMSNMLAMIGAQLVGMSGALTLFA